MTRPTPGPEPGVAQFFFLLARALNCSNPGLLSHVPHTTHHTSLCFWSWSPTFIPSAIPCHLHSAGHRHLLNWPRERLGYSRDGVIEALNARGAVCLSSAIVMPPAMPSMLAGRAPVMLRAGRRIPRTLPSPARSLTTASLRSSARSLLQAKQVPKRLGTISIVRNYSSSPAESAPNTKAYIDSGIIKHVQNVDVKKVLVIGSGGLAIGQAGEFDYSGLFPHTDISQEEAESRHTEDALSQS